MDWAVLAVQNGKKLNIVAVASIAKLLVTHPSSIIS